MSIFLIPTLFHYDSFSSNDCSSFFGIYGIIKGFIERLNKSFLEIVLKLLFFNAIFLILLLAIKNILGIDLKNNLTHLLSKKIFTTKSF